MIGLALLYPALLRSRSLLAIMDIRARPISFSDRPSSASRATRSRTRRRDRSSIFFKFNSQTSAGAFYYQAAQRLTEAIPSEPPSGSRKVRNSPPAGSGIGSLKSRCQPFATNTPALHVTFMLRLYSVLKERIGIARIGAKHSLMLGILLGRTIYTLTYACTKSIVLVAGLRLKA